MHYFRGLMFKHILMGTVWCLPFLKITSCIAQEFRGEVIGVAQYAQTYLLFPGSITQSDIDAKDLYICRLRGQNGVIIIPKSEVLKPTVLVVTEGNRTHQFNITPRQQYDPNKDKLFYDYSTTKKLKDAVAAGGKGDARASEPTTTQPAPKPQPTPAPSQEIAQPGTPATNPLPPAKTENTPNAAYQALIEAADKLYTNRDFAKARETYLLALAQAPGEKYPKDRIETIEKIQEILNAGEAERQRKETERQEQYTKALAAGDKALQAKQYSQARISYTEAQRIKPEETTPRARIEAIDMLEAEAKRKEAEAIAQAAEARKVQQAYDTQISEADKAYKAADYSRAQTFYEEALRIKPAEKYPATRLDDIKLLLEAKAQLEKQKLLQAREREINTKYQAAIAKADKALTAKEYEAAENAYKQAKSIKPAETYPDKKLEDIALLKEAEKAARQQKEEAEKQRTLKEKYDGYLAQANRYLNQKDYSSARAAFLLASTLMPNEALPKEEIKKIDDTVAQMARQAREAEEKQKLENEKLAKYRALIAEADDLQNKQDYRGAKRKLEQAAQLLPADDLAKQKLQDLAVAEKEQAAAKKAAEDEQLRKAREAEVERKYQEAINRANLAFNARQYPQAKLGYNSALQIRPNDKYATSRLEDIEALELAVKQQQAEELARLKAEEEENKLKDLLAQADRALANKDYDKATAQYKEALKMRPSSAYAISQLQVVEEAKKMALLPKVDARGEILLQEQKLSIPLAQPELFKKYPQFVFGMVPGGQKTAADYFIAADTLANNTESVTIMAKPANLKIKDSTAKISVTLERIQANETNVYLRFVLKNFSDKEYLAGVMNLALRTESGDIINYYPVYVTGFPYLLPDHQYTLVYATRLAAIGPSDKFVFTITDRLKQITHSVTIPGEVYMSETMQ